MKCYVLCVNINAFSHHANSQCLYVTMHKTIIHILRNFEKNIRFINELKLTIMSIYSLISKTTKGIHDSLVKSFLARPPKVCWLVGM